MEARTVWAVVSGEYSDYKIHVLFPTEQQAEAHAARRRKLEGHNKQSYGAATVEPFLLVEQGEPDAKVFWHASCWYGTEPWMEQARQRERAHKTVVWETEQTDHPVFSQNVPARPTVNVYKDHVSATGPDKRSVTKAVADRVAQLMADHAGIT